MSLSFTKFSFHLQNLPSILCPQKVSQFLKKCSPENVQVTCNPVQIKRKKRSVLNNYMFLKPASHYNNRFVRETTKHKLQINFDMVVFSNNTGEEPTNVSIT